MRVTKRTFQQFMPNLILMLASSETYKGIEYVRISSLPLEQKNEITNSFNINLVINILKDEVILNDCLQYKHYVMWYEKIFAVNERTLEITSSIKIAS